MTAPIVGTLTPFLTALDAGFSTFETPTIDGLARVTETRIDFLAVVARNPGKGDFHRFIEDCKQSYDTIAVWEIFNANLKVMLARWGFREVLELMDGSISRGMRWDKEVQS